MRKVAADGSGRAKLLTKEKASCPFPNSSPLFFRVAQLTRQSLPAVPAAWQSRSRRVILDQQCEVLARLLFASRAGCQVAGFAAGCSSLLRPAGRPLSPWKLSSPL